jgi:LysM repeat protein
MAKSRYTLALLAALALLGACLLAGPALIRGLPGRYAYYLPEPLQKLRHNPHPDTLPTPATAVDSLSPPDIVVDGSAVSEATQVPAPATPSPTPLPPISTPLQYTVRAGDTLGAIALTFTVSIDDLVAVNSLTDPDAIYAGQTLTIPVGNPRGPTTPTSTSLPTPTATPLPPTPVPAQPTPTSPVSITLSGLRHEHQGWNNCGPTTLAMALSYWGCSETQYDVAPVLKPDSEDKNVSPWEMESYVRGLGLGAIVRVGGTLDRIKALVNAGFPVIVETWYVRDARDQLGHYRLVTGYDDAAGEFLTYDSLHGPDVTVSYQEMDELWRVFDRLYLVVYAQEQWGPLAAVLGPDLDDASMHERSLETARFEAATLPERCVAYADCADWVTFSWFNVGSSLTALGRHAEAAAAYDQARQLGLHYRMLWYQFGPYESYHAVGRYDDVIALADATLATTNNLEESYYWRGMARLAQGDADGARADFEAALRYHEDWPPAVVALAGLTGSP